MQGTNLQKLEMLVNLNLGGEQLTQNWQHEPRIVGGGKIDRDVLLVNLGLKVE